MNHFLPRDPAELTVSDLAQDDLFIRWVRSADADVDAFWNSLLAAHPEMEEKIEAARTMVLALQFQSENIPDQHVDGEWIKLYLGTLTSAHGQSGRTKWFPRRTALRIAASLLLLLAAIPAVNLFLQGYNTKEEVPLITRSTLPGQKLSLTLSDGTKVKLNSDSEIRYPTKFTRENREVTLKGEAFFDVVHKGSTPFKVHTSGITVVVMGTSFNVTAYPENADVKVALEKGKVKIEMSSKQEGNGDIFLKPNEMIEINKSSFSYDVSNFDLVEMTSWKEGCLYLGKAGFHETVAKLERWYGVKFEIDARFKSNPDWRFIGKFQDKSLPYILEALRYPDLFQYRIEEQKVFIFSNEEYESKT